MCRSWSCAIALAVLAVTASSGRAAARAGQSGRAGFVITHVRVFDGHQTRANKDVVVADGRHCGARPLGARRSGVEFERRVESFRPP
jgi:hypothetical protein